MDDFSEKTIENVLNLLEECGPDSRISFGQDSKNLELQKQFEAFCDKVRRKERLTLDWELLPLDVRQGKQEPSFTPVEARLLLFLSNSPNITQRTNRTGNLCRFCLNSDMNVSLSDLNQTLLDVAREFFHVRPFDGFSQQLCLNCLSNLRSIQEFNEKCRRSHQTLLNLALDEICINLKNIDEPQKVVISDETSDLLLLSSVSEAKSQLEESSVIENDVLSNNSDDNNDDDNGNADEIDAKDNSNPKSKDTKIHTCEYCSKTFRKKLSLKVHIRSHTNERPFSCSECKKAFKTYSALNNHRASHSTDKKFECSVPECNYRTTTRANLNIHGRTHTQERRYTCSYCQFKFTTASNLSKHVKNIHCRIKTLKCNQCEKTFFTKESARKHEVTHSNLKPYSCPVCSLSYAWYNGLQKHMKAVHPGIKSDTEKMYFDKIMTENK